MDESNDVELYRERLPDLVDYLKGDQVRRAVESGKPIIHITVNEAARPAPVEPRQDVLAKYAPYLILATWSMVVATGVVIAFIMMATAIMTILISLAVCTIAVAGGVRSLRMSKEEARAVTRGRQGGR